MFDSLDSDGSKLASLSGFVWGPLRGGTIASEEGCMIAFFEDERIFLAKMCKSIIATITQYIRYRSDEYVSYGAILQPTSCEAFYCCKKCPGEPKPPIQKEPLSELHYGRSGVQ